MKVLYFDGGTMVTDWQELTKITGGEDIILERISVPSKGITISGSFDLPPLAKLSMEDQVFVAAFVRCHGSIKQMENIFGISYPTVKNRLNKIGEKLEFVEVKPVEESSEILGKLERGEISVKDAVERLRR